ncbi:DUF3109 family protein [Ascidiimonas aurantiaca]|uniref:DUF3109 family protein n=1 Tax=Ascidiimonas aurantiaca TaxID=1685432 RepID=UPI0030EBE6F5
MFQLEKTIVSEEILENDFVCNLSACKGACCVEGDAGAPLEVSEMQILEELYDTIQPFLRKEGVAAIEKQGLFVKGADGEWETPLVNQKECAYVTFDKAGIAKCGIEEAYHAGAISWKKPVSCHLYPVRIKQYRDFAAVNYHRWHLCDDACALGKELQMPIYRFVKEALIRKFGEAWYKQLEIVARDLKT